MIDTNHSKLSTSLSPHTQGSKTILAFHQQVNLLPQPMRSFCLFSLFALLFSLLGVPVASPAIWECGFEPDGKKCVDGTFGNTIDTFKSFKIPPLPGGGKYCITAKGKKGEENSPDIHWYAGKHHTKDLYARLYFFLPENWRANTITRGGRFYSLKFWRLMGEGGDIILKVAASGRWSGPLLFKLYDGRAAKSLSHPFPDGEITRGKWHYLEVHSQILKGDDLVEIWLDTDSKSTPPTVSVSGQDIFQDHDSAGWNFISMNSNWSGYKSPARQTFYIDGMATDSSPIGDTYHLLEPR